MTEKISFTQSQIDKMIEMYNKGIPYKDIAEYFHVCKDTVRVRLHEYNVTLNRFKTTEERAQRAIDLYNEVHNVREVCRQLHMNNLTLKQILTRNNIRIWTASEVNTKHIINAYYFDKIDSHRKAYYLGLLFADGTLSRRSSQVLLSLQERDKDIIYQFKEDLECDYKISMVPLNKKNSNWQNHYRISICNKQIHDSLLKHGMVSNKSLVLEFPKTLDKEYYPSFILGYVDGDGHLAKNHRLVDIVGTRNFLLSISEIVKTTLDVNCCIYKRKQNPDNNITCDLHVNGRRQSKIFLDWIYSKCDIHIERKYITYQNWYEVS